MEYTLWRYRNLSVIAHTTWRRPKHGEDPNMLAGSFKNDNFKKRSFLKTILSFLIFRRRFLKNENVNIPKSALPPCDVYLGLGRWSFEANHPL